MSRLSGALDDFARRIGRGLGIPKNGRLIQEKSRKECSPEQPPISLGVYAFYLVSTCLIGNHPSPESPAISWEDFWTNSTNAICDWRDPFLVETAGLQRRFGGINGD
jgi:hypothetical protein